MRFDHWSIERMEQEIARAQRDIKLLDKQIDELPSDAYFSRITLPQSRLGQVHLIADLKAEIEWRKEWSAIQEQAKARRREVDKEQQELLDFDF